MPVRHILFDLDGTLLDSAECILESARRAFPEHGFSVLADSAVRTLIGVPIEKSFPRLLAGVGVADTDVPRLLQPLIDTYRRLNLELAQTMITPFDGVRAMLDTLDREGFVSSIVTSKRRSTASANLDQHGLLGRFRVVIGSEDCHKHKPDPEPALVCLRSLGLSDANPPAIVVGDSTHDVHMAIGAGLPAFGVSWGVHHPDELRSAGASAIAHDCEQLVEIILNA